MEDCCVLSAEGRVPGPALSTAGTAGLVTAAHPPPHRHTSRYTVYSENSAEWIQMKKM